jgi:hypothetical protein
MCNTFLKGTDDFTRTLRSLFPSVTEGLFHLWKYELVIANKMATIHSKCILTMGGTTDRAMLHQEMEANRLGDAGDQALIARVPEPPENRDATVDFDQDLGILPEEDIDLTPKDEDTVESISEGENTLVDSYQQDKEKGSNNSTFPMQTESSQMKHKYAAKKTNHNGSNRAKEKKIKAADDEYRFLRNEARRKNAAHLQHLAALVPGLCLEGSWPSDSMVMDADRDDRTPSESRKTPNNEVPPMKHKSDTIKDMMTQAQKSLSSKDKAVNEGDRNVSLESTDRFAKKVHNGSDSSLTLKTGGNPGIRAIEGRGPSRSEKIYQSKLRKRANLVTASLANDMQENDSKISDKKAVSGRSGRLSFEWSDDETVETTPKAVNIKSKKHSADAPEIIDLVFHEGEFGDSKELKAPSNAAAPEIIDLLSFDDYSLKGRDQKLTDATSLAGVYAAATGVLGIVENQDAEKTPNKTETKKEATEKHDAFKERYNAFKERCTSSTGELEDIEESDEEARPSKMENHNSTTEEPNAFEETDKEKSSDEIETLKKESPGEIETPKDNKEHPDLATDTEETGDETVEEESVNESETSKYATQEADDAEEKLVEEIETSKAAIQEADDAEEKSVSESETSKAATQEAYDAEEKSVSESETSEDATQEAYDAEEKSVSESETSEDATQEAYDAEDKSVSESETSEYATQEAYDAVDNSVSESETSEDATQEAYDAEEKSVSESETSKDATQEAYDVEEKSVSESETSEDDKEESPIEGATMNLFIEEPKVVYEADEEKKPSDGEVKKREIEELWKQLDEGTTNKEFREEPKVVSEVDEEEKPRNIEVKKKEAEKLWKQLEDLLQADADEEETCTDGDEQDDEEFPHDDDDESADSDDDDNPRSDLSDMAFDFVLDFAGIVQTLSEEFSDTLMPGKENSKSKHKFRFRDVVNDAAENDEANARSQRLADRFPVLANIPPGKPKVYVHWDKNVMGSSSKSKGLVTGGNKNHELHVESDLSSLTAMAAASSTDPGVVHRGMTTSFHLANRSLLSEDNDEEEVENEAAPPARNWNMCCI